MTAHVSRAGANTAALCSFFKSALFKWSALRKALVFLRKFFARFISNRIVYRVTGSWAWVAAFVVVVLAIGVYLQSGQPSG